MTEKKSMGQTYRGQSKLPRLPIPTLEDTMEKFPRVMEAVLPSASEREETKQVCDEFAKGPGPKLQAMLEKYAEDGAQSGRLGSYVEEFWNEAYLAPDCSVVLNLNPFFVLEDGPDAKLAKDQIGRSASLVFATLKLASMLKNETLEPDTFRGTPLCMDQFKALFGSCRLPHNGLIDCISVDPDSSHVVVMNRNQVYYFQALWSDGSPAVDESDIKAILHAIKLDAAKLDSVEAAKHAIGVLTTLPRKTWALARENLTSANRRNQDAMNVIDSALFVLVLDDYIPPDIHNAASNMLHGTYDWQKVEGRDDYYQAGTCLNRWYDKLQIIVCGDGSAGINFEHSAIDGHTALRFVSDIYTDTVVAFAQSITNFIHGVGKIPSILHSNNIKRASLMSYESNQVVLDTSPRKLKFELPPSILDKIFYAETALGDQIVASDMCVLEFKDYGKSLIVSNKMSPDSFVQMSMLLAYYRLYGEIVCMYEPVLTKQYYHGRTEAMRSATPQAAAFCKTWMSTFSTKNEKMEALILATKEHSRLVKESAGGKGVDRHLFALKCIADKNGIPTPAFFKSSPWKALNHTVLSTSNCGNPSLRLFGFGPVVPDGFGIGYIIKDHALQYSVSSKHRQTRRFVRSLEVVLSELKGLLMSSMRSVEVQQQQAHPIMVKKQSSTSASSLEPRSSKPIALSDDYDGYYGELAPAPPLPPPSQEDSATKYFSKVMVRRISTSAQGKEHGAFKRPTAAVTKERTKLNDISHHDSEEGEEEKLIISAVEQLSIPDET